MKAEITINVLLEKKCCACDTFKNQSDFDTDSSTTLGISYMCKKCNKNRKKKYYRTKYGLISRIYGNQKSNSKNRWHRVPEYTKNELKEWLYSQKEFHELFDEWKQSGYEKDLIPSVDRKHDDLHYFMKNIQLTTWFQNRNKLDECCKSRNNPHKSVLQFTKEGVFIAEYCSAHEASKQTGTHRGNLSACCRKNTKYQSAGGYVWKFKNEEQE